MSTSIEKEGKDEHDNIGSAPGLKSDHRKTKGYASFQDNVIAVEMLSQKLQHVTAVDKQASTDRIAKRRTQKITFAEAKTTEVPEDQLKNFFAEEDEEEFASADEEVTDTKKHAAFALTKAVRYGSYIASVFGTAGFKMLGRTVNFTGVHLNYLYEHREEMKEFLNTRFNNAQLTYDNAVARQRAAAKHIDDGNKTDVDYETLASAQFLEQKAGILCALMGRKHIRDGL